MTPSLVTVHEYQVEARAAPAATATASSLRLVAALNAPARQVELERILDLHASIASAHPRTLAFVPPPSLLTPRGIAEWAREHPAMPPPPAKPGTELQGALEFEHWRRTQKRSREDRDDRGKRAEKRSLVKCVDGPGQVEAGPSGETGSLRKRRSTAAKGKELPLSPVRRSQRNKNVLVVEGEVSVEARPPTPATTPAVARNKLSEGAILRCIPYPHRFPPLPYDLSGVRPQMPKHQSPILHSFVDPPPPRSKKVASKSRSSGVVVAQSFIPSTSPATSRAFPIARSHLAPALRGFWLIPITGPLPYSEAAIPIWDPPPVGKDPRSTRIYWTDARLAMLWTRLAQYRELGRFGPLDVWCHFSAGPTDWPDHIRVGMEAEYALAFRVALALVKASRDGDAVKFLDAARLVWIGEQRRKPILIA